MSRRPPARISVVIPVRDRADLLRRALRSVDAQTYPEVEVLVIDDGSPVPIEIDRDTCKVPVRLLRNTRSLGAQRSRLLGAEAATGKYVALLDSDDWWHPDKLRRQAAAAEAAPDAVLCSRVVAARGDLRRAAPWRPLAPGERVEEFLYVHRGMLQSSTVMAARSPLVDLLRATADGRVHNDTMLFLEAQRRGLPILQLSDPLSYFDDNPRPDRVSYDLGRIRASDTWFDQVSPEWSLAAQRGFILVDKVPRYVNAGQRRQAFRWLLRSFHSAIPYNLYLRKLLYIACGGSPFDMLRVLNRCLLILP